jgi:hypothetical protein
VAELGVPEPFVRSFLALERLDDETAQTLFERVAAADPFGQVSTLQAIFRDVFPSDLQTEAQRLVPALLSLRGQLRTTPPAQIAETVSNSVDLDLEEQAREHLRDRLLPLLASAALSTTANALELLTQHDRNYQTARVVTDIRPIFADDVHDRPEGAVIVDTLQLNTWDRAGRAEMLAVAMDEVDLRELRDVIDRALVKTSTLRDFLTEQQISCFQLDTREL